MTGSKVEGYTTMGGDIENVVTGKIKKIVKHPHTKKNNYILFKRLSIAFLDF